MAIIALLPCIIAEQSMVENEDVKFLYNMMMIGLIIAISTSFLPFAERMLYYSRTYILLAVPYACNLIKGKKKTIYNVFRYMDSSSSLKYTGKVLNRQVGNWQSMVPGYTAKRVYNMYRN